ncbi:RCC1 domain-containing protein [Helicobacter cappadocius]|uniref:Uncharacterized protein n=1 Tax=Helicobacter cappadocius TaxID=3063998 RepID=A0AA90PM87_9HELI|nr:MULTISPECIES: hypothetical protein [unclassified Helicobacter]MDO7253878.1 hypothetical protein [Helicobacter sp. faydin-H75]MDP2539739.1 hypothetical protein [Helicobacter sp. faydin-H76]
MENLESLENKIEELKNIKTFSVQNASAMLSTYSDSLKNDLLKIKQDTLKDLSKKKIRLLKNVNGYRCIFYQEVFEDKNGNIIRYGDIMVSGGDITRSGAGRSAASMGFYRVGIPSGVQIIDVVGGHGGFFAQEKDSNAMWVWGTNAQGCLGVGHTRYVNIPQRVTFNSKIKKILSKSLHTSYQFAFVLLEDGTLLGAGRNTDGELGIGNNIDSPIFLQTLSDVKDVFVGNNYAGGIYAICNDGRLFSWGYNRTGWLGLGHSNSVNTPSLISNISNAKSIYHSTYTDGSWYGNTFIITTDNKLLGAGYNGQYNLSQSDTNQRNTFVPILDESNIPIKNIVDFKGGGVYDVALALNDKGELYSWGCADMGLGDDRNSHSRCRKIANDVKQIEKQSGRYSQNFVLYMDESMRAFGYNASNNLGIGNNASPIRSLSDVVLPSIITDFYCCAKNEGESVLIATDGNKLYACGISNEGVLNVSSMILQPQILR